MSQSDISVFIIDDDELIRDSLEQLIKSVGLKAKTFSSARAFLNTRLADNPSCLVTDIRMPGMSGLELQDELLKRDCLIPIIFITGHGTVPMSVRAMKSGAVDFLQKPFEDQELLDVIHHAVEQNVYARSEQIKIQDLKQRIETLSMREYDVLIPIISGMLNKEIAHKLGVSESTVKTHRAHIMQKMAVDSFAELVRAIEKLGIYPVQINSD